MTTVSRWNEKNVQKPNSPEAVLRLKPPLCRRQNGQSGRTLRSVNQERTPGLRTRPILAVSVCSKSAIACRFYLESRTRRGQDTAVLAQKGEAENPICGP